MGADIQMTPGDKSPNRYRKHAISAALLALIAAGASQTELFSQLLDEKEGNRLVAYLDGSRVWTICRGLTRIDGLPVTQDMRMTDAQCRFHNEREASRSFDRMERLVKPAIWQRLSAPARVGITDFCIYQIGEGKCQASTFLRLLNSGAPANDYCAEITKWIRDGGRDCRKQGSNCQGQPIRRMQEDELCLMGDGDGR